MGPIRPELIRRLIDNSIIDSPGNTQVLIILIIATLILESVFNYIFIFVSNKLGQSVVKELRTKVFEILKSII
jgi:subfamily B ATP-binding cassette protein MsbA